MPKALTKEERKEKFEAKFPEWELLEYTTYTGICKVRHHCGYEKEYQNYNNIERRGPTCPNCYAKQYKWYYNVGDIVDNLIIINRRMGKLQEYQYKCLICGFDCTKPSYYKGEYVDEYWVIGRGINAGNRCACCRGFVVQPGINDVATTDADIVEYFYDAEDARRYSRGSERKVLAKCPICNTTRDTMISVSNLVNEGFDCLHCGQAVSYPERVMYFLLKSANIEFQMHKVFDWSKSVYSKVDNQYHVREYDFYIPHIDAIIEMHGSQHYRKTFSFNNMISHEDQKIIDSEKQNLAEQHCKYYITIDCRESNKNYIQNSILNSELYTILNLNNIDWGAVSKNALKGIAKLVVEDKNNHPYKTTTMLADEYQVHYSTIITWLKNAEVYDPLDSKEIAGIQRSYPIYSPELGKAFRSTRLASEEIGVGTKTINSAMNPNIPRQTHAGRHPVTGERLTWERWTLDQYEEWCTLHNTTVPNNAHSSAS